MASKQNDEINKRYEDVEKAYIDAFHAYTHGSGPISESMINLTTAWAKFTVVDEMMKAVENEHKIQY